MSAVDQIRLLPSTRRDWETPRWFYEELDREFGFELDVAAEVVNAKCSRFFTIEDDGLAQTWAPSRCWMNPPYGRGIGAWVARARAEAQAGALVVGLLPSRTDTAWFHDYCWGHAEVRFVRGRIAFSITGRRRRSDAPFAPMVVIWRPTQITSSRPETGTSLNG